MVKVLSTKPKKVDLGAMTDSELAGLMGEMQSESSRRNKLGNPHAALFRSRWFVTLMLLCVAFFILFKAETSGIKDDAGEQIKKADKADDEAAWSEENDSVDHYSDAGDHTEHKDEEEAPATAETPATPETPAALAAATPAGNYPVDKADDKAKETAFAAGTRPIVKYQYSPRSAISFGTDAAKKAELAAKWGSWTLVDPKANDRPTGDYAKDFPSRDVPWDKFPANAWQLDKEYLPKFLTESQALVDRALEALMGEYGWGKDDMPDKNFTERLEGTSFDVLYLNMTEKNAARGKGHLGDDLGGWITPEFFEGIKRRVMHALITDDTFTMVMGGHSAAAGHGNHLRQSYTMQFFKVLEPIFARLGVKLHTTNNGYGGLGTGQNSFAAGDLYGREIDIYVWDTQMTENSNENYDLFVRQGILSNHRVPVLMGGMRGTLEHYYKTVTQEVGMWGSGTGGAPLVTDAKQALSIPWATRYLRCEGEMHGHCREMEYNGTCWIERDDYTPETKQTPEPGGRASWHPGFRQHAVKGRIIAFTVLRALLEGLKEWDESPDKRLPEEKWHVHDHYENIRDKFKAVPNALVADGGTYCFQWKEMAELGACETPFNGASEMTPRANPRETALVNLMKPAYNGYLPVASESVYSPPDVFIQTMETPEGEFDYLAIVENGIDYAEVLTFDNSPLPMGYGTTGNKLIPVGIADIKPGLGWFRETPANPDGCDGSYDGFCNRGIGVACLLSGHNDHRGGMVHDAFSGWGVFTLPGVKLGVIFARMEWWGSGKENKVTEGWEAENNGDPAYNRRLSHENMTKTAMTTASNQLRSRRLVDEFESFDFLEPDYDLHQSERKLGGTPLCDDFFFDFAVNGKITTYNKAEYHEHLQVVQRVVQIQVMLNDTTVCGGNDICDVEVAMRIRGCAHVNAQKVSGIYWA